MTAHLRFGCCALLLLAAGCDAEERDPGAVVKPLAAERASRDQALEAGRAVIAKHQCTRCHEIDGLPGVGKDHDCVKCHRMLKQLDPEGSRYAELGAKYGVDVIERYRANIRRYLQVPSLTKLGARVRADFIDGMLQAPTDQRPLLEESMIRTNLGVAERATLLRYFATIADDDGALDPREAVRDRPGASAIEAGRERLIANGCPTCHTFGALDLGVDLDALRANPASLLAPDLALTRTRMRASRVVQWIMQPATLKPDTRMPPFTGTRADAEAIADFLWFAADGPAEASASAAATPPPSAPTRDVSWDELKERVLGAVCVHCHMDDGERDRGAGNAGGLGHRGVGLSLRTYAGLVRGARDANGQRRSVLVPGVAGGEPPIVEAVLRRRKENLWDHRQPFTSPASTLPSHEAKLGMPMGLPALDDEQLGLLRRWIAEDCPGPEAATGRPDMTSGYLVPDRPIAKNRGCELRP